ncbi:MAG: fasciclin domain-containing protein [Dehalococcoidia bacterium]|nr:fasciclin domain-containing protein [Dehalococcoidia bacterium]MCB9482788.1 fasciclin domain-containing protein [Dehalococcoidia bacterium]
MKRLFAAGLGLIAVAAMAGTASAAVTDPDTGDERTGPRQEATADIVDTAIAAGDFSTLVAAVQAAGLEDTLRGPGPFTVFAPTDAAFAALPAGTLDSLLADPEALADILLYHVVSGEVLAADVVGLNSATAANGDDISIEVVDGTVVLNGSANVVATDVMASNGVIHVIDAVILPPADTTAAPTPAESGNGGLLDAQGSAGWLALGAAVAAVALLGGARFATARRRS